MSGFQRFDPERWEPRDSDGEAAKAAKAAKVESPEGPALASLVTLATLPGTIKAGLVRLSTLPAPNPVGAELWPEIVNDALGLASDGWAAQALGLGWSPLDLYGAVTDPDGDPAADGLAVKLEGRRVLALCATFATVADANGGRTYLYRGNNEGAGLLWTLERGR